MNEIENILKEKPIVLPRYLFNYYLRLGITPEELIILIFIKCYIFFIFKSFRILNIICHFFLF